MRKPEKVGYSTEVSLDKALENVLSGCESNERLHEASNVLEPEMDELDDQFETYFRNLADNPSSG